MTSLNAELGSDGQNWLLCIEATWLEHITAVLGAQASRKKCWTTIVSLPGLAEICPMNGIVLSWIILIDKVGT
jgi:hypothetical protein